MRSLLTETSDNLRGALWMMVSVLGATGMTVLVRELSPEMHTRMIAFLRSVVGMAFVVPMLVRRNAAAQLRMKRPWLHVLRGALLALALNFGFYAIWQLPVATATILFFLAPVFSTLLAPVMVGERVGPRRWSAVGVGFLGALIVLRPGLEGFSIASLAAVGSSLMFGIGLLLGKRISQDDGSDAVFFSSAVIVALLTLPIALPVWSWPTSLWIWVALIGLSAASSLRGYADIRAFAIAEASFVGPISYLRLPAVALAGWWLYQETLDWPTLLGGGIIAGSTLYIMLRERALKGAARA